jgi:hypothetical protein
MRGYDDRSSHLFSYLSPEQRVPADHPLRAIRTMDLQQQSDSCADCNRWAGSRPCRADRRPMRGDFRLASA